MVRAVFAAVLIAGLSASGGEARRRAPAGSAVPMSVGATFRECAGCPQMVVVPTGKFLMGSPASETGRFDKEGPQHSVTIERPFAIGVFLITRAEYAAFVKESGYAGGSCRTYDGKEFTAHPGKDWRDPNFPQTDRDPVVCVNLDDAHAYVAWLNSKVRSRPGASGAYRMLSESEWEFAARGGTQTPYWWGTTIRRDRANYGPDERRFAPMAKDADRWLFTSPGDAYPANPFGIHDMAGNVFEWTEDCAHPSYVGAPADGRVWAESVCKSHILRGGSWLKPPTGERSAMRGDKEPQLRISEIGFRIARTL